MIRNAMAAFSRSDAALVKSVWEKDKEFDDLYSHVFPNLITSLAKDPERIVRDAKLALWSKDLNEISEHATNIAEMVMFMVARGRSYLTWTATRGGRESISGRNAKAMKDTEAKARTAIALLREGLREFDFQRLAKASSELVRSGVLESSHGIELSKTVGFLRHVFHDVEEWEREHPSG